MTMQILEIVLYNQNGEKRTLSLLLGKVNIITGSFLQLANLQL